MDPVSVLGLVSSLITIADVIKGGLTRLRSLQSNYTNSSLAVSLLIGQLNMLKAALDQITEWVSSSLVNIPKHQQLVLDLSTSVESCKVLLTILDQRIGQLTWSDEGALDVKGKIVFLWEKLGLNDFTNHLNNQTNALNLLLTALSCRTTFEQNSLLQRAENRSLIKQIDDTKSSLLCLRDSESGHTGSTKVTGATETTENSHLLDVEFDFDRDVTASDVYRAAFRSNIRRAISKGRKIVLAKDPSGTRQLGEEGVKSTSKNDPKSRNDLDSRPETPGSEFSQVKRWLATGGGIVQTTEFGVFSSRISQVSSKWRRRDSDSIYSIGSFRESAAQEIESNIDIVSTSLTAEHMIDQEQAVTQNPPEQSPFNVLFVGTANSGKSTIFKSIEALNKGGWTMADRLALKENIFANTIESMVNLLVGMESLGIPFGLGNWQNGLHAIKIIDHLSRYDGPIYHPALWNTIDALWCDSGVQEAFRRRNEYILQDNAAYLFNSVKRFREHDFIPSNEDILAARIRTLGLYWSTQKLKNVEFRMGDAGGERSGRRKWPLVFEGETLGLLIYTVDLSAYDLELYEAEGVNHMSEALTVFKSIFKISAFKDKRMVIVFTKLDLLESKILKVPFTKYSSRFLLEDKFNEAEFEGDEQNLNDVKDYIERLFLNLAKDSKSRITTIFTRVFNQDMSLAIPSPAQMVVDAIVECYEEEERGEVVEE